MSFSCRPWSHPTMPPSRALWELLESSLAFLSLAVFLTKCLLLVSYSLTRTKTWCWRCIPTWQWSPVRANNTLGGLLAMPGWFDNAPGCWVLPLPCSLGKGDGQESHHPSFVFALPIHFLWTKKRKCKETQSVRMGTEWIPNSNSKESEYRLHLSGILTKTQGLGMGPDCTCWKLEVEEESADFWDCPKDIVLYFCTRFWKQHELVILISVLMVTDGRGRLEM